jgi:hypothetical protein
LGAGGKEESAKGGSVLSEVPGGGTIPLSVGGKELLEPGNWAIESEGNPALLSNGGKGLFVSPGAGGKELSANGGKPVSVGLGGGAMLLSKGGRELSEAGSWAIGLGGNPGEPLSKGGSELLSPGTGAAATGGDGNPPLSMGGRSFASPGNPGAAVKDVGGEEWLLSRGGNPFESPGKAGGAETMDGDETSPGGGAKAGKLLSAMGGNELESPGDPGAAANGAGETGGSSDCGGILPEPGLGGFPAGRGGNDRSPEGAVPEGAAGKEPDESRGRAGMELSEGIPVDTGDPTGGNPPELELSAGKAGSPGFEASAEGKAGKPELSEDNPGFEFTVAPGIAGVELSVVKGGRAEELVGGMDELSAPRGGRDVPLSSPLGRGGNPPSEGTVFPNGMAFELELSVGRGGRPLEGAATPASGAEERFEPAEATPLSGRGGKLDVLEAVVSSLGKGGKGDELASAGVPLACFAIAFFLETKYMCLWKRPMSG